MHLLRVTGLGFVLLAAGLSVPAAQDVRKASDTLDVVKERLKAKKAVLIDVREKAEWNRGHLEGAVMVPLSVLYQWQRDGLKPADRAELDKSVPKGAILYCHCAAGVRAVSAGEILRSLGYDARSLQEGYRDLLDAGFPKSKK